MKEGSIRYHGMAWGQHFLPRLTKREIEQIPKESALVVLLVGSVEQHGPHLPVFTDTLIGEALLSRAFEHLPHDANIWLLPPLVYGKSNEHLGHPGTISLSANTLMQVLMDIAASIRRSGFHKLLLFNSHGGNTDLLNMMAREIRIHTGLAVFRLDAGSLALGEDVVEEREKRLGIHAGDVETSLILALQPSWVQFEHAPSEMPVLSESRYLSLGNKSFAWLIDDLSASGALGDARNATAEKGRKILEMGGRRLADALLEMVQFNLKGTFQTS